jgi:hypothetical protein
MTFQNALKIIGILVRKNTRALHQREVRINFEKVRPYRPRVFRASRMTITSWVMMSSLMPSEKYSCSGSPDMLVNGKTAIDGFNVLLKLF